MTARKRTIDLALAYLDRHMYTRFLFPIKAGAKFPPLLKDNLDGNCTNDPEQARAWEAKFPGCNWGLAHRKSRIMAVDVDTNPKKGKQGQKTFDDLDLMYGWPDTETTTTPSGGFHKIYEGEHVFALGENGIGLDIDSPNYTLIPGSTFDDGTSYVGNGADAVPCPQWIYDTIKGSKAKNSARLVDAGEVVVDLDKQSNIDLAIDFLKEDAEPAIQGSGGDFKTLKTAMYLKDVGISPALALDLMVEYYNPRCEPEWERDDLERKIANAYNYASLSKAGGKTAEADFADDIPEPLTQLGTVYDEELDVWLPKRPADVAKAVAERRAINAERAASPPEDRERIWKIKEVINEWAYIKDLERFTLMNDSTIMWKPTTFDRAFAYLGNTVKSKSVSEALLKQKTGTLPRFNRAVYKPGSPVNVGGDFNMYVQPDIVPAEGDVSWWDDHLAYLLPSPDDRSLMLNWLAWFVQNIGTKPKHAMLLQGTEQGTGKSFIVEMLARIINRRNTANINQTDLHGDFNGWAARSKLLAIEELRAIDRTEVANKLHPLITQDIVSVNEKNLPRRDVENCFGIFAMSNHDAAITLDQTDRRYLVINTPASPRFGRGTPESVSYYKRLYARLSDPVSVAAVAYLLQTRDVGNYDGASAAPLTFAKAAMIKSGQSDLEQFIEENAFNYPFNLNLIRIDDVIEALPSRLQRGGRLHSSIASILKTRFNAYDPILCTLSNREQRRLYPIGPRASMLLNLKPKALAALYEKGKADAKKGIFEELDASDEFGDTGDVE